MRGILMAVVLSAAWAGRALGAPTDYQFSFGIGTPKGGIVEVPAGMGYAAERGYGFEANANVPTPGVASLPPAAPSIADAAGRVVSDKPFIFSAAVPEGVYRVTVTMGDPEADCTTTIKAEARRLMVEQWHVAKGQTASRSFLVQVRRPEIPEHPMLTPRFVTPGETGPMPAVVPAGVVKLDPREPGSFTWDDKLSLEFTGGHAAVQAVEIHAVKDAVTVFLCSDSTVTDQPIEPYGSWGQMLPRWFDDKVCVANFAESGETLKAFLIEKRWDKVMSLVKKGDYVFMQFGNNDSQASGHNGMWPADDHSEDWNVVHSAADGDYQTILKDWAGQVKAKGAVPVIIAPYTRQTRGVPDKNVATPPTGLRDYPAAAEKAAKDSDTAFLNLTAISTDVLNALGPTDGLLAYVDGQHTRAYGAYLNSRSVTYGIQQLKLDLAQHLVDADFDPKKPVPLPAAFDVPLEPTPGRGGARGGGTGGGRGVRGGPPPATAPATTR